MTESASRTRRAVVAVAAFVTVALTSSLGVWQLRRGAQKDAIAQALTERAAMPPLAVLPTIADGDPAALWHRRITLRGRWLASHTVFLDNRQQPALDGKPARVGFVVITPLALADGRVVAVQRGFALRDFRDRAKVPSVPTPAHDVVVEGAYAPPPARLYEFNASAAYTPDTPAASSLRQNLDLTAFAQEVGGPLHVAGTVLQRGDDDAIRAGVLERLAPAITGASSTRHHGYAFQWFGLSALVAGLYVWFQLLQPRWRRRAA